MFSVSYRNQIIILVLWIVAVTLLFRLLPDRQLAALVAGAGFLLWPILFIAAELKKSRSRMHLGFLFLFLFCSALPIFLLRILNWGQDFSSLDLFGIPANALHRFSNATYILMLISAVYRFVQTRAQK